MERVKWIRNKVNVIGRTGRVLFLDVSMIGTAIGQPGLQHCLEMVSDEGGLEAPRNSPTRLIALPGFKPYQATSLI